MWERETVHVRVALLSVCLSVCLCFAQSISFKVIKAFAPPSPPKKNRQALAIAKTAGTLFLGGRRGGATIQTLPLEAHASYSAWRHGAIFAVLFYSYIFLEGEGGR